MDNKLIEIIEDRAALEMGLRVIMRAIETKELPDEALLPTFCEEMEEELLINILEKIAGKKYE